MTHTVLIIGAGPAGLTAALELVRRSNSHPIVLEALNDVGGISRTIEYAGQPHGHRRPPLLFQVRLGDGLVAADDAASHPTKTPTVFPSCRTATATC
jgi:monoamine oxidase